MKYPVYMEKDTDSDYGVTVPDLPGCFSAGSFVEEALENAEEAVLAHIEGLYLDGEEIPRPTSIEELRARNDSPGLVWALVGVDLGKLSKEVRRLNITMPENILSKVDAYARKEGSSRSGFLAEAALDYMARNGA